MLPSLDPTPLPAQPLAVQQVRPRKLDCDIGSPKTLDCVVKVALRRLIGAHKGPRFCFHAESPVGAGSPCRYREPIECGLRDSGSPRSHGGLDELGENP